uniref:Integrase_H2C2 domain-containing protein n=1 Tax=Glossina austeni TaxID=7395 RepID=A0A1A9V7S8_GLOAU
MGGTLSQFATLRSEVDALKETAARQQLDFGDNASKVQAPMIDDVCNVLCPKRQNKNKRPKATVRELRQSWAHCSGRNREHFGVMKTVKAIKRRFYWVGCRKSVAAWIHSCEESGKSKEVENKLKG